jgi:hypothetical protein
MAGTVNVVVRRSGKRFDAEAVLDLPATAETIWQTITDYPALPRFMPGIRACRVVDRQPTADGERLRVEQRGEFRFLLFAQSMNVDLEIDHRPLRSAFARATRFDVGLLKTRALDVFEGRYEIEPMGEHLSAQMSAQMSGPMNGQGGAQTSTRRSGTTGKPRARNTAPGAAPRTRLRYTATIVLRVPPPPAVGSAAVRQNLAAQLHAVAQEVARRTAA